MAHYKIEYTYQYILYKIIGNVKIQNLKANGIAESVDGKKLTKADITDALKEDWPQYDIEITSFQEEKKLVHE